MKILITAASTALAYKLQKQLPAQAEICFADSEELPEVMLQGRNFLKIPPATSSSFSHQMLTLCLDNGINEVYPLRKDEVYALAEARQLFEEYGIKIMVPEKSELDKYLTESLKGDLVIVDSAESSLKRGAFIKDADRNVFRLFTVD